jgi:hypothetical protein
MRAVFVTLLMAAIATPGAQAPAPKPVSVSKDCNCGTTHRVADCNCGTTYRTLQYWKLHRPSTQTERAETGRLNREYLASSQVAARASAPPPGPDPAQLAYQQQMKNYRILTESYERRMRDYARLHAQAYVPPTEETRLQDSARLDPYHGYNAQGGNGY